MHGRQSRAGIRVTIHKPPQNHHLRLSTYQHIHSYQLQCALKL